MDGMRFRNESAMNPMVQPLIVSFYKAVASSMGNFPKDPEFAKKDAYVMLENFWSFVAPQVKFNTTIAKKEEVDSFFYPESSREPEIGFENYTQAVHFKRKILDLAARNGIYLDFSSMIEDYENYGRDQVAP